MAEVDTSFYKSATPQFNPIDMAAKVQGLQQGVLNNRLLGQTIGGKEALGRAVTKATDPSTGNIDWNKALSGLAQDPEGSFAVPEFGAAVQSREKAGLDIDKSKLELGLATWKTVGDAATSVLTSQQPLTREAAISSLSQQLATGGVLTRPEAVQQFMQFIAHMPESDAEIRQYLQQGAIGAQANQEHINMLLGTPQTINTGDKQIVTRVGGIGPGGGMKPIGAVENELSPAEQAALVDVVDQATGIHYKVPRGSLPDLAGGGGGAGGSAPAGTGTGRYPGAGGGGLPGAPAGAVAAASLAPGEVESRTASATQSATAFQKDMEMAGGYAQRIQGLNKATESLEQAFTGPGTDKWQKWGGVLNSFGIKAPTNVDSYAEAQKYLQDYANRRGADLGMGTDAARELVNAANPGVQTPKGAALAVVSVIKGLERMQATQVAVAQAEGVTPAQYNAWRAKWNRSVDPGAFAPPRLTKAEWESKAKSMGAKWPAYQAGLKAAVSAKVLAPSDYLK